ncbi:MAG TPA: ATP-binding protein, partial [Ramlibacter sp.]|uniref:AAA family ATPase n=1 Tax=Ramlibacter sp. TaxID=1917967 RepID=UPI002D7E6461
LWITCGLPGSGKTFQSQDLLEREGAIRIRSDVERKRLHGLGALARSREHGIDLYTPEATRRTYARLFTLAGTLLQAGWPVVLDAAFLRRAEREEARALARTWDVPFSVLACEAPLDVLRERLRQRSGDASEADLQVLEKLAREHEALGEDERG